MPFHDTATDEELLRATRSGDEAAFAALYRRRQGGIYRFALQMSGSAHLAEDVTQETFLALISDPDRFDPERGSLAAFLYGIARNLVLRRFRRERPYVAFAGDGEEADDAAADIPDGADDPLAALTRTETIESVRQAVLALPEHYREAVVLCDLHEMSYADAAAALGCAIGTVRSRLHRARALLVGRLREDERRPSPAVTEGAGDAPALECRRAGGMAAGGIAAVRRVSRSFA